jgi:hypothetical protein
VNDVEPIEAKRLERASHGGGYRRRVRTFDLEAKTHPASYDQQVELSPGVGRPEKAFLATSSQPPPDLSD